MPNASRDENFVTSLLGVSSSDGETPVKLWADPTTHRLLVDSVTSTTIQVDVFTSTDLQTAFTATRTPVTTIYLSINGLIQTPTTDYTVAGSTATLSSGIPAGYPVIWVYTY